MKGNPVAVRSYRELLAWQRAMDMVIAVYKCTRQFPKEELYGLTNQLRRAAVSVPSNIAEGQGRGVGAEFRHHLRISQGSLQEVETQIMLANRLEYLDEEDAEDALRLADEVGRLMRRLHESIRTGTG
jgi:four helix bundle protein